MTRDFIGYGRISRVGDRAERLRSDRDQKAEIGAAAKARGLRLLRIEFDYDESGARADRPRLMLAIEAIERGEAAGIIVARLDRFSRDTRHTWELAERIHAAGGTIISYAEQTDWTTPSGELQVGLIASFARFQRRILAESFKRAKAGAVAAGIPVTTRMAPGLRLIHDERGRRIGVEHDPDVADAIAEAFAMRARGEGPKAIGDHLTARGVRTSMGASAWSKPAVYGLLRNRAYLGELWNGENVNRTAWPPIVDEAMWLAAQRPLGRVPTPPRRRPERIGVRHPDLGVGLVRCASCRYCLNATTTTRDKRVYRCVVHHAGGRCPAPARMYADELEPLILAAFWQLVRTHHASAAASIDTAAIDDLRRRADRSRRKWEMHRDDPDVDQTIEALGGLDAWRAWIARHRAGAEADANALAQALAATGPELPAESALRADWPTMPREIKRRHLASLIDCAALLPASSGLPRERRVVVFAAGTGPDDLPRRGYRASPTIRPFNLPPRARVT